MTNSLDEVSRLPLFLEEIAEETGMGMAEMMSLNVVFDGQIKRFHEYKRQQMNALAVIHQYLEIKAGHTPSA